MRPILPPRELVTPDTALLLSVAAAIAFPDRSVSAAKLKAQADAGKLATERIGRRYYTTLRAIGEMREKCRVDPRDHAYGCGRPGMTPAETSPTRRHGVSETLDIAAARVAAQTTLEELRENLRGTSQASTSGKRHGGTVVPIKSRSRMSSHSTPRTSP
jgi:hypothetical protein